jgi:NADPH-dependent 2,4-dienoyl-CoA reductase/sulfur reductase-like enzyme/rhodanese-related sulfurtransferase
MAGALKVVVVGGVAAGPKAAARARRCDPHAEITILEQGDYLSYSACGLPYLISGETPDLQALLATPAGVVRDANFFQTVKDIRMLTGKQVTAIDRSRKLLQVRDRASGQDESYPYDKLVLATGATPVRPPIPGIDLKNVFLLRRVEDGVAIRAALEQTKPRRAVLIGAGAIGLEMAAALKGRGLEVTLIEALDQIMPGLDVEMAALLQLFVESQGVKCRTRERVLSFASEPEGGVARVFTDRGEYAADLVVVAVGVRPNVELGRQAGLEVGATGALAVDQYLRTSDPDIFAGGDCAECFHRILGRPVFVSSGQQANVHGRIIGTNVVGGRAVYHGMVGTAVAKVFDYTVGLTGISEAAARREGVSDLVTALVPGLDHAHYFPGAKPVGLKMVAESPTGRLLGVQVVGPGDGAKRLDVAAAALTLGASVESLTQLNLGFSPPYSEAIDLLVNAAQVVENKLTGIAQALSPLEVQEMTARGEDFMLLDVRTPAEFQEVRLKHPQVFAMPLGKLRAKAQAFPKDRLYIPFCNFSVRGYEAQKILEGLGFKKVKFMDGGVLHWPFELESGKMGG